MRSFISTIAPLLIVAGTGAGCGDSGGPASSVLTTLELAPVTATLFTVAPGNAVTLSVVAKDQNGQTMAGVGAATFSSDNGAIVGVGTDGTVTAVAAGTARITASLTVGGVTKTGFTTVTAQVASANAVVVTPAIAYKPATVDVQLGGTVTWTFDSIPHTVTFTTPGAPASVAAFQDSSAAVLFPTHGNFSYHCTIHPSMNGTVQVH